MWNKIELPLKPKPLIILSGPSGVGKSTLVQDLLNIYGPDKMAKAISHTTRPPRGGEIPQKDYHFVTHTEFEELKDQNFFIEWAKVYQHYYGTSFQEILKHWHKNQAVITDVDTQGADSIKKFFSHVLRFFILPPSMEVLQNRRQNRNTNNLQDSEYRQKAAKKEIEKASEFNHQIINLSRSEAVKNIKFHIDRYLQSY